MNMLDRDTIIRLAREAGAVFSADGSWHKFETQKTLERFAVLVAAHEREECAKLCEARYMGDNNREDMEAKRCAAAIRSRT